MKALTAACLIEVFRLFHPNPPYDDEELKVSGIQGFLQEGKFFKVGGGGMSLFVVINGVATLYVSRLGSFHVGLDVF